MAQTNFDNVHQLCGMLGTEFMNLKNLPQIAEGNILQDIQQQLQQLQQQGVRQEQMMGNIQTNIQSIRGDIQGIRGDVQVMQQDIQVIQADIQRERVYRDAQHTNIYIQAWNRRYAILPDIQLRALVDVTTNTEINGFPQSLRLMKQLPEDTVDTFLIALGLHPHGNLDYKKVVLRDISGPYSWFD